MDLVQRFHEKYGRVPTEFDPDYLEMLRMSKYRILDVPDYKPGKCANCGSSKNDGRKYIDFGLEVDWYGIVYLCGNCLDDVSRNAGLFNTYLEEIKKLKSELLDIKNHVASGTELRDDFLKIFREVQDYITSLPAIGNDLPPDNSSGNGIVKTTTPESGTPSNQSAVNETKQRAVKSAAVTRSKNVPSLAELLKAGE